MYLSIYSIATLVLIHTIIQRVMLHIFWSILVEIDCGVDTTFYL